ncbi:MFS transporter [Bacillus paranthracis]
MLFRQTFIYFSFFRAVQAIGIAAIPVVSATIIGDLFEGKERGEAMSLYQMLLALAPAIGPSHWWLSRQYKWPLIRISIFIYTWHSFINDKPFTTSRNKTYCNEATASKKELLVYLKKIKLDFLLLLLASFNFVFTFAFSFFLPSILTNSFHLTVKEIGLMFVPMSLSIMLGSFCYKFLQKRLHNKANFIYYEFLQYYMCRFILFHI